MQRISTATRVPDKFGAGKDGFTDGDVIGGVPATDLEAALFDSIQEEIAGVCEGAGLVLDVAVRTQLAQALQRAGHAVAAGGGTANALTAAFIPAVTALPTGVGRSLSMILYVRAAAANTTTTPTFAADGTAAKTIVKGNNLPLVAGDIAGAGHWLRLQFDPTLDKWVLLNPAVPFGGFGNSLSSNGYQRLPGGLIIQWGSVVANTPAVAGSFPITFPGGLFSMASTSDNSGGATSSSFPTKSSSGFTAYCSAGALSTTYIAIGY